MRDNYNDWRYLLSFELAKEYSLPVAMCSEDYLEGLYNSQHTFESAAKLIAKGYYATLDNI